MSPGTQTPTRALSFRGGVGAGGRGAPSAPAQTTRSRLSFLPPATTPSTGPMRTPRPSCPSRQGSTSTFTGTWTRTASMKVSWGAARWACWGRATHLASLRGAPTAGPAPTALYGRVSSPQGCGPHHVPEGISCLSHLTAPAPWAPPADPFPSRMGGGLDWLRATPPTSGSCCCLAHVLLDPCPSFRCGM